MRGISEGQIFLGAGGQEMQADHQKGKQCEEDTNPAEVVQTKYQQAERAEAQGQPGPESKAVVGRGNARRKATEGQDAPNGKTDRQDPVPIQEMVFCNADRGHHRQQDAPKSRDKSVPHHQQH